jgi:hypothetical protein
MARRRRRQKSSKKKRKAAASQPAPKPPINRNLLSGVGLAIGLAFAGLMIFLFSGDDEAAPGGGPNSPVARIR